MSAANGLRPSDLAMFAAIGVDASALAAAGVQRVTTNEARTLGIQYRSQQLSGLFFPYADPTTGARVTGRLRRDAPEIDADGKPIAKYLAPFGDVRRLYFAPGSGALLDDVSAPVVFVEAEKSALALPAAARRAERRVLPIATGGCWGWRGVTGKTTSANGARVDQKGPLPDFDRLVWRDRNVSVCFDANTATNPRVQAARCALVAELTRRGAIVRIVDLPVEDGVNGPDDFIGQHGAAAFFALIDAATSAIKADKKEKAKKPTQGRDVQLDDPEPWVDPVDGVHLLDSMASTFTRYLTLPVHASTALALWVLHAFSFSAWFTSPFLAITSPAKRCGKTLLLIVLGALVPRRLFASNVTPAVLFRTIEKYAPTLLIDEADTFIRDNDELRGVLNSGHTRTTAVAIRAVGDDHEPRAFSTWCPKTIALIGKLPDTLADRAIEIAMRRRTAGERVARLRQDRIEGECAVLRRQAARWAADHLVELRDADPVVPTTLQDRAADCWRPLLAIADRVGGEWPVRAREAAVALSGEPSDDEATTRLLRDIRDTFSEAGDPDVLASAVLIERLVALEDRPWREWAHGRPLSPAKLARLLAGYGVYPAGNLRIDGQIKKGYRRAAFEDAWARYVPVEALQRYNPSEHGHEFAKSNRYTESDCSGLRKVTNLIDIGASSGVAASGGDDERL